MKTVTKAFTALLLAAAAFAEEDVFLSLTRKSEPLSTMPTNAARVTAEDMEDLGAITLDEGLWATPSVIVQKSGTLGSFSTIRLRGSPSSGHQQFLVDDVPLTGVSTQFMDVASQLSLNDIERVEILRGGASVLYGPNTLGGVVHVVTKRPEGDRPLTRLKSEFRSFFTQVYEGDISGRSGGWDGYVSGGRALSDGFQDNQDADNIHATVKTGYSFGSGLRLSLGAAVTDSEVGNPKGTLIPVGEWDGKKERGALEPNARVEQNARRGNFGVFVPLGEASYVQSTLFVYDQDFEVSRSSNPAADAIVETFFYGNDTRVVLADALTVGASYLWDSRRSPANNTGMFPIPQQDHHVTNFGSYIQYSLALGKLHLIPALRRDEHSAFGAEWNPRLTAVLTPSDRWKYSANAARAIHAPTFLDLYYEDSFYTGNPDLRPEVSWTYDAGVEFRPGRSSRLAVTGFYTEIENRLANTPFFDSRINAGTAEIMGVEFENQHLLAPRVKGQATYTYTRANGSLGGGSSKRVALALTPRHSGFYRVAWTPSKAWEFSSHVRYTSKQYKGDDQKSLDLPPYATWGLRVEKAVLAARLYFAVDNILERRYALTFDNDPDTFAVSRNPQPGRTFLVGFSMRFQD